MKKFIVLLVLTTIIISCGKEVDYALISVKVENAELKEINITGNDFKKVIPVNEDGSFTDTLYLSEKGYYSLRAGRESTSVFLENGYNMNLTLDVKEFDESLTYTGEGAEINNYLAAKYLKQEKLMGKPTESYVLNEADFKTKMQAIKNTSDSLLAAARLGGDFEALEKENIFYAYGTELLKYPSYHSHYAKKEGFEPGEGFYDELKDVNYQDETIYARIPSYRTLAANKLSSKFGENYDEHQSYSKAFLATVEGLPKSTMKDEIMNGYIGFCLTTDENMDEVYNMYVSEVQNEEYKAKIEEKYSKIKNLVKGKPSPTFDYENHKGGKTALADLKGKYVYVDVWATWCGPCKAEIPSLKKLEEDYHDKNIEFVSISVDRPDDYETWKKMVAEKELGGIQLMSDKDWKSDFVTGYAIEGIPRFILIDPDGNIVSADAPRPSNEKIRVLFEELKI